MEKKGLAMTIFRAKKQNKAAFPSNDIPSLVELAVDVVADNFSNYPGLEGIFDDYIKKEVSTLSPTP